MSQNDLRAVVELQLLGNEVLGRLDLYAERVLRYTSLPLNLRLVNLRIANAGSRVRVQSGDERRHLSEDEGALARARLDQPAGDQELNRVADRVSRHVLPVGPVLRPELLFAWQRRAGR